MKKHFSFRSRVSVMMLVLFAAVFALSASRSGDARLWLLTAAVPAVMVLLMAVPSRILFLDRPSLSAALVLSGFGIMAGVFIATGFATTGKFFVDVFMVFPFLSWAVRFSHLCHIVRDPTKVCSIFFSYVLSYSPFIFLLYG